MWEGVTLTVIPDQDRQCLNERIDLDNLWIQLFLWTWRAAPRVLWLSVFWSFSVSSLLKTTELRRLCTFTANINKDMSTDYCRQNKGFVAIFVILNSSSFRTYWQTFVQTTQQHADSPNGPVHTSLGEDSNWTFNCLSVYNKVTLYWNSFLVFI